MFNKKRKKILLIALWLFVFIVFVSEIARSNKNKKGLDEELKKFYVLQNERDRSIKEKQKIVDELPENLKKVLAFVFFILMTLVHVRCSKLLEYYNNFKSVKERNNDNNEDNKKNKNSSIGLLEIILVVIFVIIFFINNIVKLLSIFYADLNEELEEQQELDEDEELFRKPVSTKKRIGRIFYKISFMKEKDDKRKSNAEENEDNKKNNIESKQNDDVNINKISNTNNVINRNIKNNRRNSNIYANKANIKKYNRIKKR